jgi:hypothetical protein
MTESCHTEIEEAARVGRSSGSACQIGVNIAGLNVIQYGQQHMVGKNYALQAQRVSDDHCDLAQRKQAPSCCSDQP